MIELDELLTYLENELRNVNKQQAFLPKGSLARARREDKTFFQRDYVENNKRKRQTISKDRQMFNDMARKVYLEEYKKVLEADIKLISSIKSKYVAPTATNILKLLKPKYEEIPREMFFNDYSVNKWENQTYEQSTYKEDEKKHMTSKGLRVRSKSEMLIAERLYFYQVPFRYEEVLHIGAKTYIPDFTIMSKNGKIKYWEHCGLPNDKLYIFKFKEKLYDYESVGIVPWKNLIVTYEEEGFNLKIIDSEIQNKLLSGF